MATGFKIADGYVEIHAEFDHSEVERVVRAGVASVSRAARTLNLLVDLDLGDITRRLSAAISSIPRGTRTIELLVDLDMSDIVRHISAAIRMIPPGSRTIELLVDIDTSDLARKIAIAIRMIPPHLRTITLNVDIDMGAAMAQLLALQRLLGSFNGSGSLTGVFNFGSMFANPYVAAIGAATVATLGFAGVITLLAPLLYTVGGLLGASTTLLFGLAGVAGVVALGLRGVGGAIKEMVTEGKVANDTLKKLAPSAREFVLALQPVKGLLEQITKELQQRLFLNLAGDVRNLIDRLGPLRPHLGEIADGLNHVARQIIATFADTRNVEMMATIFSGMGVFVRQLGDAMRPLLTALIMIGEAAMPVLHMLGESLKQVVGKFAEWIAEAQKSGALQNFFNEAAKAIKDIFNIGGLVFTIIGQLIGILFPQSKDISESVFSGVRNALQNISDWLSKPENQAKVREFVDGVTKAFTWLRDEGIPALQRFMDTVKNEWIPKIEEWIAKIEGWKRKFDEIVNGFQELPGRIGNALGRLWDTITEPFRTAWDTVTGIVRGIVETVGNIFGTVGGVVGGALGPVIGVVAGVFGTVFSTITGIVGNIIGTMGRIFGTAAGVVGGALGPVIGTVAGTLGPAIGTAANVAGNIVNALANGLRSAAGAAAGALGGVAGAVGGALGGIVSSAYNIGLNIASSLANGIRGAAGAAANEARNMVSNALNAAKSVLRIGSPSKVFRDEIGAMIPAGIEAGIRQGIPSLRSTMGDLVPATVTPFRNSMPAAAPSTTHYSFAPGSVVLDASKVQDMQSLLALVRGVESSARQLTAGAA